MRNHGSKRVLRASHEFVTSKVRHKALSAGVKRELIADAFYESERRKGDKQAIVVVNLELHVRGFDSLVVFVTLVFLVERD